MYFFSFDIEFFFSSFLDRLVPSFPDRHERNQQNRCERDRGAYFGIAKACNITVKPRMKRKLIGTSRVAEFWHGSSLRAVDEILKSDHVLSLVYCRHLQSFSIAVNTAWGVPKRYPYGIFYEFIFLHQTSSGHITYGIFLIILIWAECGTRWAIEPCTAQHCSFRQYLEQNQSSLKLFFAYIPVRPGMNIVSDAFIAQTHADLVLLVPESQKKIFFVDDL